MAWTLSPLLIFFLDKHTVKSHIKELRRKLAGVEQEVIETVWGVGYRSIPPK
jgi:DNA-binding response OmpR family regulator